MSKKPMPVMSNHTKSTVASAPKPFNNQPHASRVNQETKLVNSIMAQSNFKRK